MEWPLRADRNTARNRELAEQDNPGNPGDRGGEDKVRRVWDRSPSELARGIEIAAASGDQEVGRFDRACPHPETVARCYRSCGFMKTSYRMTQAMCGCPHSGACCSWCMGPSRWRVAHYPMAKLGT